MVQFGLSELPTLTIVPDIEVPTESYDKCPFHESSRRSDGSVLDDGKDDKNGKVVIPRAQKLFQSTARHLQFLDEFRVSHVKV